ncbi:AAA family ATPase [uncultured Desulfovibrio sp.]|uniref:ExeA family protein n=1 Tax=uncultured Desulfovibrio sp. TaxID=167968 RepID=UPI00261F521C|nr:AAA family ATPase [uncultured Desulfovibrio sp.]
MLMFKALLKDLGASQREVAEAVQLSPATLSLACCGKGLPKHGWNSVRGRLAAWLHMRGIDTVRAEEALREMEQAADTVAATDKGEDMILRKQALTMRARQHFKLLRDPFDDSQCPDDVYLSPESRYVREFMHDAALHGNFLAVVGESGSGKSTLREDLIERLRADGESIVVIEPYTLSMSGGQSGKPMLARHIAEAVIATLSPGTSIPRSQEVRDRRLHQLLRDSNGAGMRHVLIIEEAHDLHTHTLKSLKRFWELKDGMTRLLSIILIGQTELLDKLGSNRADVREVVQRCMSVTLEPVKNPAEFLAHRFSRAGADIATAFEPEALEALHDRLIVARDMSGRGAYKGYPLTISNFAIAAMNMAAGIGERMVTADVVRQVRA